MMSSSLSTKAIGSIGLAYPTRSTLASTLAVWLWFLESGPTRPWRWKYCTDRLAVTFIGDGKISQMDDPSVGLANLDLLASVART